MASTPEAAPIETAGVKAESSDQSHPETGHLKRKASRDYDSADEGSPKRTRRDENGNGRARSPSPYDQRRRPSIDDRRPSHDEPVRRPSATLEDKKRGKRLFGGLLSTLSQTNTNSQQKRRQEIEKRQQERLQKQRVEDDQKREEKLAQLKEIRMAEQMEFERKVMRNKHSKLLWAARHLKTKAEPHIYYRPFKLTREQEDFMHDQVADAKEAIERDREAFRVREQKHTEQYGHRRLSPPPKPETEATQPEAKEPDEDPAAKAAEDGNPPAKLEKYHDDSNEVVVMDEDSVIY